MAVITQLTGSPNGRTAQSFLGKSLQHSLSQVQVPSTGMQFDDIFAMVLFACKGRGKFVEMTDFANMKSTTIFKKRRFFELLAQMNFTFY